MQISDTQRVQRVGDQLVIADDASESVVVSMAGAAKLRSALAYYEVQFARDTARVVRAEA